MQAEIKQRDVAELAVYSTTARVLDITSVVVFLSLQLWLAYRIWPVARGNVLVTLAVILFSYLAADFISGVVHWMGDTWGSPETPVLGQVFIRPFREHHVDQASITRHDFFEVNGNNSLVSLPVLIAAHFLPLNAASPWSVMAATFIGGFLLWIFATNQFHKWAHLAERPWWIAAMQRMHLILPYGHHQVHHAAPYEKYYCITSGWMNAPLHRIRFFPTLERVISAVTGFLPRQDDIGEVAAKHLVATPAAEAAKPST